MLGETFWAVAAGEIAADDRRRRHSSAFRTFQSESPLSHCTLLLLSFSSVLMHNMKMQLKSLVVFDYLTTTVSGPTSSDHAIDVTAPEFEVHHKAL